MYRYEEDHAHGNITNEQWERIWEQSAAHSIEHIQPQSSTAKYVHFLGNLMLLTPGLNSTLSGKTPAHETTAYRATGLHSASEVAQMIERDAWGAAQVEQREQRLLDWARKTWGAKRSRNHPILEHLPRPEAGYPAHPRIFVQSLSLNLRSLALKPKRSKPLQLYALL